MKTTLPLLLLITLALNAAAGEVSLRVMSWNLEGWQQTSASAKLQAEQMANSGAHVIGLQECESSFVSIYRSELQRLTGKTWYQSGAPTPNTVGPIFSTYPILESEGKDIGRNSWGANRTALRIKINVNGVALNIFTTHLDIGPGPEWGPGYRNENISILLPWLRTFTGPKILTGDMNSHWNSYWVTEIKKDYTDTWQDVTGSASSAPVSNEAGWRPDYVFRSKESAASMRPTSAWVISTPWTLSDHRPVMADIAIVGSSSNLPPSISLTAPANNASFTAPATINFSASASDSDGAVTRVEFFNGSVQVGDDLSSPYSFTWSGVAPGTYSLSARATDSAGASTTTAAVTVNVHPATVSLPGRIEAENYRLGGYYDSTSGNSGGNYRRDDVDIEPCTDTGAGYNVGWIAAGEWLAYNVNVSQSGMYNLTGRVASAVAGTKVLRVLIDGSDVSGAMSFTDAGGWQSWSNVTASNVNLTAGAHELRIQMDSGAFNLNYLDLSYVGAPPRPLPGRLQAEDYSSYYDTSSGNTGAQYRSDGVDIEGCTDTGGGYNVGWIAASEWLAFNVNVSQSGLYNFTARVASAVTGTKTLRVLIDDADVTGAMSFSDAGGWQSWRNVSASNISLSAGAHQLRIRMDTAGFNVNYLDVAAAVNNPPAISSGASASPSSATSGQVISFSVGASDADGDALTCSWNFGDGASGSGASTTHAYSAAGTYLATVTVSDGRGGSVSSSVLLSISTAYTWSNRDIGAVGLAGGFAQSGGSYTLNGAGKELYGNIDAFHFAWQTLTGDGTIVARVAGLSNVNEWCQAGVMMRETLTADSKHVTMMATVSGRAKFRRRYSVGGSTTSNGPGAYELNLPQWVKLVRAGNSFSGYRSDDGSNWVLIGTDTVALSSTVYVGLYSTSAVTTALSQARVDSVQLNGSVTASRAAAESSASAETASEIIDLGVFSATDNEKVLINLPVSGPAVEKGARWALVDSKALPQGVKLSRGKAGGKALSEGVYTFSATIKSKAGPVRTQTFRMSVSK